MFANKIRTHASGKKQREATEKALAKAPFMVTLLGIYGLVHVEKASTSSQPTGLFNQQSRLME